MNNKEASSNLLKELLYKIEMPKYLLPPENDILNQDHLIKRQVLYEWKASVDDLVRELSCKYLGEFQSLDSVMTVWAGMMSEDQVFLDNFNKLGEIIEGWRKVLREIFFKDASIYTMPPNYNYNYSEDVIQSTQEELKVTIEDTEKNSESDDEEISDD